MVEKKRLKHGIVQAGQTTLQEQDGNGKWILDYFRRWPKENILK